MLAKICWLCLLITAALLAWSGFFAICSGDNQQECDALIVEEPEQVLGEQLLGSHSLELCVRNTSSQPRRILGMTGH